MKILRIILIFIASATWFIPLFAQESSESSFEEVSGDTMVEVGDPGNSPYVIKNYYLYGTPIYLGGVDHPYKIGKYEVTVGDWQKFLMAVASRPDINHKIDAYGLWNKGMLDWIQPWDEVNEDGEYVCNYDIKNKKSLPITHVSLYSALCYINWKEHGSPILEAGADVGLVLRHGAYEFFNEFIAPNRKSHFYLPSQDEWIKAAYYTSNKLGGWYSIYPTQYDAAPGNHNGNILNQANYNSRSWFSSSLLALTPVDDFSESKSYYGCYDMGGNVNEWTYTFDGPDKFIVRGGSYESQYNYTESNDLMIHAIPKSYDPATESSTIGFRIAERDEENTNSKNNIPIDLVNKIKERGVALTSAECYDGYVAAKNIYYCSLPEKITKSYEYSIANNFKPEEINEMRTSGELKGRFSIDDSPHSKKLIIQDPISYEPYSVDTLCHRPFISGSFTLKNDTTQSIQAGKNPGDTLLHSVELNSRDYYLIKTGIIPAIEKKIYKVPFGALEIPKQLIVGGITSLAIGVSCEFIGKYLGEEIGYLFGRSRGAAQGELIGEDIGVVAGMVLPFLIFI